MKLDYDPLQVFRCSKTPSGLYARQKWLNEADTPQWQADFNETVAALWADHRPDGSWHGAPLPTVRRLFGLHLTVRSPTPPIEKALDWLLAAVDPAGYGTRPTADAGSDDLTGLPFMPSRPVMLLTGAALFMAAIFGRQSDPAVRVLYRRLCEAGVADNGRWGDAASSHNIFRAMVVHPEFAGDPVTERAVARLAALQTDRGDWSGGLPFYQTLNALAHLDLPRAEMQLEKAFARLFATQNRDGTWGRTQPEWHTFLSIHALKNKGLL